MFQLDPDSRNELEEIGDDNLRAAVERVLRDPSGQREPRHNYTRRFRNPSRYVRVARDETVYEFKPSRWRGLFVTAEGESGKRGLFFIPIRRRRFWTMSDCPWH